MFAGKTEELLRRVRRLEYAHKNVVSFKPSIDDRYLKAYIVSRDQHKALCVQINNAKEMPDGKPASYNDPLILIGASEAYEARCASCHEVPRKPRKY